jgi:hypothetical protein
MSRAAHRAAQCFRFGTPEAHVSRKPNPFNPLRLEKSPSQPEGRRFKILPPQRSPNSGRAHFLGFRAGGEPDRVGDLPDEFNREAVLAGAAADAIDEAAKDIKRLVFVTGSTSASCRRATCALQTLALSAAYAPTQNASGATQSDASAVGDLEARKSAALIGLIRWNRTTSWSAP